MSQFDPSEIIELLQIPQLVAGVAPQLTQISSEAMARLVKINEGLANAKADPHPDQYPGQPVEARAIPSQPIEPPKSEVAQLADDPESEPQLNLGALRR